MDDHSLQVCACIYVCLVILYIYNKLYYAYITSKIIYTLHKLKKITMFS